MARDQAASALAEIKGHQRECVERQKHIEEKLDNAKEERGEMRGLINTVTVEMREGFRRIYRYMWSVLGSLVMILLGIVGFLLVQIFFKR